MSETEEIGAEVVEYVDTTPVPTTLFQTDDPVEIVERATRTANALAGVVRAQKLSTAISGRAHVRVEGWTLLGSMLGVFPVTVWTRELEDGWEARVEARTRDGAVVGAAESECRRTERTWKSRDGYALRSMAQTRATSKALRHPLGFVMTLAGFEATPEEEMPRESGDEPERREDPATGRVKLARGWADWTARMDAVGVPPEDSREWLRQACDAMGIESLEQAEPAARKVVFARANDVLVLLSDGTDWALMPNARFHVRRAFAAAFEGVEVEGPEWRLGPDEADRPAPPDVVDPSAEEQAAADAIPFGD